MNNESTNKNIAFVYKHLKYLIYVAYIGIGFYIIKNFLPVVLSLFMPFILAYLVAAATTPLVNFLHNKCKFKKTIAAIISWVIALLLIATVIGLTGYKLVQEIVLIAKASPEYMENVSNWVGGFSDKYATWKVGLSDNYIAYLDNAVIQVTTTLFNALSSLSTYLVSYITNLTTNLPNALLFLIIFILSSFFMCRDFDFVKRQILIQIPASMRARAFQIKQYSISALMKYLKGMSIMFLIVFVILLTGLMILKVKYAFFLAVFIGIFDILPLFGAAMVLVPWGIISLLQGNYFLGIGLMSLCAINAIIRQFSEPKVMSDSLGLYPIITLIAVYTGIRLIGFAGVVVFPILFLIIFKLQKAGIFTIWKIDKK